MSYALVKSFTTNHLDVLPNRTLSVCDVIDADDCFSYLSAALRFHRMWSDLQKRKNYCLFAPTNDAFKAAAEEYAFPTADALIKSEALQNILKYCVVPSVITYESLVSTHYPPGEDIETLLHGNTITYGLDTDGDGAKVKSNLPGARDVDIVSCYECSNDCNIFKITNLLIPSAFAA